MTFIISSLTIRLGDFYNPSTTPVYKIQQMLPSMNHLTHIHSFVLSPPSAIQSRLAWDLLNRMWRRLCCNDLWSSVKRNFELLLGPELPSEKYSARDHHVEDNACRHPERRLQLTQLSVTLVQAPSNDWSDLQMASVPLDNWMNTKERSLIRTSQIRTIRDNIKSLC